MLTVEYVREEGARLDRLATEVSSLLDRVRGHPLLHTYPDMVIEEELKIMDTNQRDAHALAQMAVDRVLDGYPQEYYEESMATLRQMSNALCVYQVALATSLDKLNGLLGLPSCAGGSSLN